MNKKLLALSLLSTVGVATNLMAQDKTTHGIHLEYMDTKVQPGDDFFRYVNGKWLDKTTIPSDRIRWGSFDELRQNTDIDALNILKAAAANPALDLNSDEAKAVNMFQTYLDVEARNKASITPIVSVLNKINAVKNLKDLNQLLVDLLPEGGLGFYGIYVYADALDSNKNVVYVSPGSVGLPDKDYYLAKDADTKEKKQKYQAHVARMLQFLNISEAEAKNQASKVVALETKMSEPRLDRVERRDRRKTYNPMSVAELQKLTPRINWKAILEKAKLQSAENVVVSMPKYMKELNKILEKSSIEDLKAYLRWTLINNSSSVLSLEIEKASWDFYSKTLSGALEQRPIEERALQVVTSTVGEALGKLYVAEKFPAEAKEKAKEMIDYVMKAYEKRINALHWMTSETKEGAINKLKKMTVKIGYPDKWEDYSKLTITSVKDGGSYYNNIRNVSIWEFNKNVAEYGKPVDKTKWGMSPQTVNAYFNPTYNEIVFPAAIMQPPFFDYKADMAVNFGGIGAVIGHEISHAFDDSGARYNAEGNLENWWSDKDLKEFTTLGNALASQYSALEPLPGVFVDGKFTLGENIGDLGGVNSALEGLDLYLKDKGRPNLIDGFTPEQRFFISWGTIWRTKSREEAIKSQVKTDPHSPGQYRAYVPLQNVDAFYKAFNVTKENKLFLSDDKRVKIW